MLRFVGMPAIAGMAALLLALPGLAQAQTIERIDVVDWGLTRSQLTETLAAPGTAAGAEKVVEDVVFVQKTTRVPARLKTSFGVRFVVVGAPKGQEVALEERWLLPAPGLRNPQTGNVHRQEANAIKLKIGDKAYRGYGFDEEWELVPGDWTVEIWSGRRKLLSQTFTVFRPQ
jgi:hypothetical protein